MIPEKKDHPKAASHKAESSSQEPDALKQIQQEAEKAKDQYLRTLADLENTRKRLHREKEEFARYAAESMIRELLPIVDSLDHALVAVDKQSDPQAVIKGVHLIYRQLLGVLQKEGVKRIATIGETFDPHRHEAVAQVEASDGQKDGTVIEEVQVGYTMHDHVLRPAMVKVAKQEHQAPSTKQTAQGETQKDNTKEKNPQEE